jgi:hypothetical protein
MKKMFNKVVSVTRREWFLIIMIIILTLIFVSYEVLT